MCGVATMMRHLHLRLSKFSGDAVLTSCARIRWSSSGILSTIRSCAAGRVLREIRARRAGQPALPATAG